jgi:hypothetical protein
MSAIVKLSIDASLIIQILTLCLNLFAFTVPVDKWDFALKEILGLETFVQMIELIFYGWYRGQLVEKVYDVTKFRYYDWFITTPTMLFTTGAYYGYLDSRENTDEEKEPFTVKTFFQENWNWILLIFLFNAFMLWVGYLQEINLLSITWSSILGYLGLFGSFFILYTQFVSKTPQQQGLFWFMFTTWNLYGIAALFPSKEKNIGYNILDIFAKNFYGVFLSYTIFNRRQN